MKNFSSFILFASFWFRLFINVLRDSFNIKLHGVEIYHARTFYEEWELIWSILFWNIFKTIYKQLDLHSVLKLPCNRSSCWSCENWMRISVRLSQRRWLCPPRACSSHRRDRKQANPSSPPSLNRKLKVFP